MGKRDLKISLSIGQERMVRQTGMFNPCGSTCYRSHTRTMMNATHLHLFTLLLCVLMASPAAAQSEYCIPQHGGQIIQPIITSVTLGNIVNSGTTVPQLAWGYSDFTAQQTTLEVGTSYTLQIGSGDSWPHNFAAWVDMDHDMRFSDTERIGLAQMNFNSYNLSFNFTIPAEALNGPTRLRIRGVEEPFGPWNLSNDPCIPFTYGETEDYTVVITGGGSADAALTELVSPFNSVDLDVEPVTVRIENRGIVELGDLQIQMIVDANVGPIEIVPGPLAPGATVEHTFQNPVDHVATACHDLAFLLLDADARPDNNVLVRETCRLDAITGQDVRYIHSNQFQPIETYSSGTTNETTLNTVFGAGNWEMDYFETLDIAEVFGPNTCTIFIDGSFQDVDPMMDFLEAHGPEVERWVASGGRLFLNSSPDSQDFTGHVRMDLGFGGVSLVQGYVVSYAQPFGTHAIHSGPFQPIGNEWTGFYYANAVLHGPGLTKVNVENNDAHFNGTQVDLPTLAEKAWGAGNVVFGTIGPSQLFGATAMNDRANILAYSTGCSISTALDDALDAAEVSAYPNPTSGNLQIRIDNTWLVRTVQVHDLMGALVNLPLTIQGEDLLLDAVGCTPGTYIATLVMADGTRQHVRFVRE